MRMRSVAWALLLVVGCSPSGAVPGSPPAVASTSATPLATAPSVADPTTAVPSGPPGSDAPATGTSGIALVPDPAADHTLGETITISGGESVAIRRS
jgi:hypothetical protein